MSMLAALEIVTMEPAHALAIRRQDSQRLQLGIVADFDADDAERIAAATGECWAAVEGAGPDGRVVAVFGLIEVFPRRQATAWAVLSSDIGRHHLAITRFCAERVAASVYRRIEAIVECADAEEWVRRLPDLDQGELIEALMHPELRTPGVRWALACGLRPSAVLRCYGQSSDTHMLFERIGA